MTKNRMEAFSDGVLAIVITIMVLELHVPKGVDLPSLLSIWPRLLSYILSYLTLAIHWSNHHHMLHASGRINGTILWANLHFLFWLSLIPFATSWMGENSFAPLPTAVYGIVLFSAAMAYWLLQQAIISEHGTECVLAQAVGKDRKGKASLALYLIGILLCLIHPWIACSLYFVIALIWAAPDRRIERALKKEGKA